MLVVYWCNLCKSNMASLWKPRMQFQQRVCVSFGPEQMGQRMILVRFFSPFVRLRMRLRACVTFFLGTARRSISARWSKIGKRSSDSGLNGRRTPISDIDKFTAEPPAPVDVSGDPGVLAEGAHNSGHLSDWRPM